MCVPSQESCPALCNLMDCSPPGSSVHGDSPGKNTGVGCHALLQGLFPTQGSNPGLPHCRWILYRLSHQGSPRSPGEPQSKAKSVHLLNGRPAPEGMAWPGLPISLLAPHHGPGPFSRLHKYCPATFHFILTVPALHPHLEDPMTGLQAFPKDRLSLLGLLSRPPLCPLSRCPGYLSRHVFVWKHCAHHY